uniref:Protein kinase domain-containing protein n=1 Tax=Chromera velia CCMP2878 TaxID=1169474 RepID=A0A0G4G8H9_9ALVE|eukprot:Cvel_20697.t1-p1 / transcript=Cvel_20697.t1 / gene=Cvel_20697 / organism=Chromera_velia_CCMP2878 / gene_product=hypothetical protein / transcript_product=hypothetical protein / location=Cvel_scaffold1883:12149-14128(-) / protein_length=624 / sequence_SO=supercontig / SO=protein_coding / is_pseudo=false
MSNQACRTQATPNPESLSMEAQSIAISLAQLDEIRKRVEEAQRVGLVRLSSRDVLSLDLLGGGNYKRVFRCELRADAREWVGGDEVVLLSPRSSDSVCMGSWVSQLAEQIRMVTEGLQSVCGLVGVCLEMFCRGDGKRVFCAMVARRLIALEGNEGLLSSLRSLPPIEKSRMITQGIREVDQAHAKGVAHRDIHPLQFGVEEREDGNGNGRKRELKLFDWCGKIERVSGRECSIFRDKQTGDVSMLGSLAVSTCCPPFTPYALERCFSPAVFDFFRGANPEWIAPEGLMCEPAWKQRDSVHDVLYALAVCERKGIFAFVPSGVEWDRGEQTWGPSDWSQFYRYKGGAADIFNRTTAGLWEEEGEGGVMCWDCPFDSFALSNSLRAIFFPSPEKAGRVFIGKEFAKNFESPHEWIGSLYRQKRSSLPEWRYDPLSVSAQIDTAILALHARDLIPLLQLPEQFRIAIDRLAPPVLPALPACTTSQITPLPSTEILLKHGGCAKKKERLALASFLAFEEERERRGLRGEAFLFFLPPALQTCSVSAAVAAPALAPSSVARPVSSLSPPVIPCSTGLLDSSRDLTMRVQSEGGDHLDSLSHRQALRRVQGIEGLEKAREAKRRRNGTL